MTKTKIGIILAVVLTLTFLPTVAAALSAGEDFVFTGFLLNPLDGASYLAKMRQGWEGAWQFHLPFTPDPGRGSYLFLFYLFLGHLARWLGLSLPVTFHLARALAVTALVLALARFFRRALPDGRQAFLAFALAAVGSGLGWAAAFFEGFTSDFWVAEAYPFLAAYANPHFPLALALLLCILPTPEEGLRWPTAAGVALAALLLGIILPFGVVVAGLALVGLALWSWLAERRVDWRRPLLVAIGGLAPLIYDLAVVRLSPQLAAWNRQNLTPAPALWDLIVALAPALLLALPGAILVIRRRMEGARVLVVWAALGMLLAYVPVSLQRRFLLGVYIPLAGLAALALYAWAGTNRRRARRAAWAVFLLAVPTNLVILLAGLGAARIHEPHVYLTRGEAQALDWLATHTPAGSLVLASSEMGAFIPGFSGARVLYGHPFETVDAAQAKAGVDAFFARGLTPPQMAAYMADAGVQVLFWGPREAGPGDPPPALDLPILYQSGGVTLYAASPAAP